ncbi:MAG: helix-turn-helix domain-containing protein [Acidobacteriota bacterium]|nr:helix-turn-helix domain-containing protein [Acidobacteriota bacterium]
MDLVLKLREIRRLRGLSQKDVARLSGVGEKTISSFETGQRIGSLKLEQLRSMLSVYGLTEAEFFGGSIEREIAPWELDEDECAAQRLFDELRALPKQVQKTMVAKFQLMLETASALDRSKHPEPATTKQLNEKRPSFVREEPDWNMLTSRN